MDAILHFFKHLIGLCGEAHPSLIMGGGVFITSMTIYFNGNIYKYINNFRNGVGDIKMIENILSIGLTTLCGVVAIYSFIRSQQN